jgi:3-dehydroquinate dehydratase
MRKSVIEILIGEYNKEYSIYINDLEEYIDHDQNINIAYNMLISKEDYGRDNIVELANDIVKILTNNPNEEDLLEVIKIIDKCTEISTVGNHLIIALMLTKEFVSKNNPSQSTKDEATENKE